MATFTSTAPDLLEPWVTEIFFNTYSQLEELLGKVFNVKKSTKAFEDTFIVSNLGPFMLKPEGTPISYDDPVQSGRKRTVHSTWSLGFRVTMEMMDDDQHSIISRMPEALGRSARHTREVQAWNRLTNAFGTSTGIPEGDGTARSLCDTAHVRLKDLGTSSNQASPGVALSVSGLEDAITNFRLTQDEAGLRINLMPKQIVHHPNDEFVAMQILDSQQEPYTADNQINTMSRMGLTTCSVPYFTDTNNWFLLADKSQHSLCFYERMNVTFTRNKDSQTKDALFDGCMRFSVTHDDWRGVYGSQP
jgi:phage major head subunit gpT-like protein